MSALAGLTQNVGLSAIHRSVHANQDTKATRSTSVLQFKVSTYINYVKDVYEINCKEYFYLIQLYFIYFFLPSATPAPKPSTPIQPCVPNPCGANAVCQERNNAGSCTCVTGYFGNPYEGCRPECVINSDCSENRACINNKCQDPCPGLCGIRAECQMINHVPNCACLSGYFGNPYDKCILREGN